MSGEIRVILTGLAAVSITLLFPKGEKDEGTAPPTETSFARKRGSFRLRSIVAP